ncbi:hypothetical protein A2U01_0055692, partial [Trifolium medium]|nr:hypothetical protein [Trifolium medium]
FVLSMLNNLSTASNVCGISTADLKLNYELLVILCSYGKLNLVGLAELLSYTPPPEKYSACQINMDCWR